MTNLITPHTILLKGVPQFKELPLDGDIYGATPITPGMLCARTDTGTVKPHAGAAALASPIFAVENAIFEGRGIDNDYTETDEAVLLAFCQPGDEVYALLEAGTGNTTAIATLLESNGAGFLQVGSTAPVARALEAVDNDPGTNSAPMRIRVEVL